MRLVRKFEIQTLAIIIFAALIVAFAGGCASRPTRKAYTAEILYVGLGHELVQLHDSGALTGDAYEGAAIGMNAVASQLPELEQAAKDAEAAEPTDTIQAHYHFDKLIGAVNKTIDDVTARLLAKKNAAGK